MEQCSQVKDLFYDFIYLDKIRINTLLSQLSDDGFISGLKRRNTQSDGTRNELGLDVYLKANKSFSETLGNEIEKTFDTSLILPIVLLNELNDRIKKQPASPCQGDLVLISGNLFLMDTPTIKKNLNLIKHMVKENNPNAANSKPIKKGFSLVEMLPNTIQLRLSDNHRNKYWSILEPENFTVTPEHLSLKYGAQLNGDWNILCYIDLVPINDNINIKSNYYSNHFDKKTESTRMNQSLMDVFSSQMESLKEINGCSDEEYAFTPLMIFKPIS